MLVGYVDELTPTVTSGWAGDTDAPEAVVSVVIYADDKRLATLNCDIERPGLRAREDLRGHVRHGFRCEFSPALDLDRFDQLSVRFARSGELLPKGGRVGGRFRRLSPILVSAPARSGTTFLMNRLSQSRQICVVDVQPFEVRLLAYWSAVYRTLTAGPDFDKSTHPDRPEGDGFRIGSNPYSHGVYAKRFAVPGLAADYFSRFIPNASADFIRAGIKEYYMRVRDDQGKQEAMYFAEKCNSLYRLTRVNSRIFYPDLKEIVLIRDPRDMFCSHVAFFRRSHDHAFEEISGHCRELLRTLNKPSGQEFFFKYEDMISGNPDAFKKLSEFLGVPDLERGDPEREGAVFQVHATSKSPQDSIGRWRDLPVEDVQRCNAAWGEFLDQFGYDR